MLVSCQQRPFKKGIADSVALSFRVKVAPFWKPPIENVSSSASFYACRILREEVLGRLRPKSSKVYVYKTAENSLEQFEGTFFNENSISGSASYNDVLDTQLAGLSKSSDFN